MVMAETMKQVRREDIHTLESKFLIIAKHFFLITIFIFHKLLSNKEILVVVSLLLYKICKNKNRT